MSWRNQLAKLNSRNHMKALFVLVILLILLFAEAENWIFAIFEVQILQFENFQKMSHNSRVRVDNFLTSVLKGYLDHLPNYNNNKPS